MFPPVSWRYVRKQSERQESTHWLVVRLAPLGVTVRNIKARRKYSQHCQSNTGEHTTRRRPQKITCAEERTLV